MKKVFSETLSNLGKKGFWISMAIDITFLIAVYIVAVLARMGSNIIPRNVSLAALCFLIIYILVLLLAYSFFKHCVLRMLVRGKERKVWGLYLFNIIFTSVILALVVILYTMIRYFVMAKYHKTYFAVILVLIFIIGYVMIHLMHILMFIKGKMDRVFGIIRKRALWIFGAVVPEIIVLVILLRTYTSTIEGSAANSLLFLLMCVIALLFNAADRIFFYNVVKSD